MGYKEPPKHTQFKPGQSGNPNGKAPGTKGLKATLREALEVVSNIKSGNKKLTFREALAMKTLQDAIKTDGQSRRLIWNYLEGMPNQPLSNDPDNPIMNASGFVIVTPEERLPEKPKKAPRKKATKKKKS